ncbi:MAG: HepT-like ribonuclease domain-containing protein [Candidatus Hadarchaeales archaeon]
MKEKVPVDILDRIDGFWDSIQKLEKIHSLGESEFVRNKFLADLGERNAHYAIDSLLEVAKYLVEKYGEPVEEKRLIDLLKRKKILHKDHMEIFLEIVRFRSALLQSYGGAKEYIPIPADEIYRGLVRIREKLKFLMQVLSARLHRFQKSYNPPLSSR